MHLVEVTEVRPVDALSLMRLGSRGIGPKCHRKLTHVSERPIVGDAEKLPIVFELPTAGDPVELLGGSVGLLVSPAGSVTGTHRRRRSPLVVEVFQDFVPGHGGHGLELATLDAVGVQLALRWRRTHLESVVGKRDFPPVFPQPPGSGFCRRGGSSRVGGSRGAGAATGLYIVEITQSYACANAIQYNTT